MIWWWILCKRYNFTNWWWVEMDITYIFAFFSPNNHNEIAFTHITKKLLSTRRATKKIINKNLSFKTKHNELHSRFNKKSVKILLTLYFSWYFICVFCILLCIYYSFCLYFFKILLKHTRAIILYRLTCCRGSVVCSSRVLLQLFAYSIDL